MLTQCQSFPHEHAENVSSETFNPNKNSPARREILQESCGSNPSLVVITKSNLYCNLYCNLNCNLYCNLNCNDWC